MGIAQGEGMKGGQAPRARKEISSQPSPIEISSHPNKGDGQLTPNEEGGNTEKEEEKMKS